MFLTGRDTVRPGRCVSRKSAYKGEVKLRKLNEWMIPTPEMKMMQSNQLGPEMIN